MGGWVGGGYMEEVKEKRMKGRNEVNTAYSCMKFSKLLKYVNCFVQCGTQKMMIICSTALKKCSVYTFKNG